MLTGIARFATARPRWVVALTLLFMLLAGAFGATVQSHLKSGGFITPTMESARASQYVQDHFPGGNPNLVIVVSSDRDANDPSVRAAGDHAVQVLAGRTDVVGVRSYWAMRESRPDLAPGLLSKDGHSALVLASAVGDESALQAAGQAIATQLNGTDAHGVTIRVGGLTGTYYDINHQVSKDLALAESIAVPVSMLLLMVIFGSVVAASLPLAIGLFAIVATLGVLRLLTIFTSVSVFAMNMTTALGLGLAIDYSLFMVSRYREELAGGLDHRDAIVRTVQTAGRTVVFSAITVGLSLMSLLVFQQFFLKSFGYAGIAVVFLAAAAAVVLLPAVLMLLGDRVNALDLRRMWRRGPAPLVVPEHTRWYRVVSVVMRRAAPVAIVGTVLLLLLGSPFLSAKFGFPDDRVLTTASVSRQVGDITRNDFAANAAANAIAVLPDYHGSPDGLADYASRLSLVPGVPSVLSPAGVFAEGVKVGQAPPGMAGGTGAYLSIANSLDPYSSAGGNQLAALRAVPPPGPVLFGGATATNHDSVHSILTRLPWAGLLIAVATLILLFLFTGSVLIPVKALMLNVLSLSATYGAMVWIFQQGHLSNLLGFTATGYIAANMPILMFCLAFGLSMDYEIFLLSRIREEWLNSDRGRDANTHAVAMGVARTGRIFTAAAMLVAIVFVAFSFGHVSFMQLFGVGLTLAVLVDATVIRLGMVPALMRLLGTANWWAPKPLAALHRRIGLEEAPVQQPRSHVELAHSGA
jgi:RND superfamily putative drug exporter